MIEPKWYKGRCKVTECMDVDGPIGMVRVGPDDNSGQSITYLVNNEYIENFGEYRSTAQLYATAHELYQATSDAFHCLASLYDPSHPEAAIIDQHIKQLEEVMAKARGESPSS